MRTYYVLCVNLICFLLKTLLVRQSELTLHTIENLFQTTKASTFWSLRQISWENIQIIFQLYSLKNVFLQMFIEEGFLKICWPLACSFTK